MKELGQMRKELTESFKLNKQYESELFNLREIKILNSRLLIERDEVITKLQDDIDDI